MANRLDYKPNFDRDPKKVLDASRARLADIIAENTVRNELKNVDITKINKDDIQPEDIISTKDFLLAASDLAADYLAVKDRSDKLLDNLSQFNVILPDDMIKNAALVKYAKAGLSVDALKAAYPNVANVDAAFVDCIVNVMLNASDEYYKMAPDIMQDPSKLDRLSLKMFPKFGLKFLIKLFVLFIKGFLWTLFADLCKQFYKFKIKIGPFRVRPLRPLCSLLRMWVKILNKGSDVSVNPDKPEGDVSYGYPTGNAVPTKWGVCPHSFYLGVLEEEGNLIQEYRELGDGEISGEPCSVCSGGNPSPSEIQAALDIAKYIVDSGIRAGDKDHSMAYDYLSEKTRNQGVGQTLESELKKMVEYDDSDNDEQQVKSKHDKAALTDIANLRSKLEQDGNISNAADSMGDSIGADEITKGVLAVNAALLKVWDGPVSALNNIYTVDRLDKDLICCFITAISLVLTSSMSEQELLDFKAGMGATKHAVIAVLRFLRTMLDTETDWLASDAEIQYLEARQLLGTIQDAMIKTLIVFLTPVVDEASKSVNKYINPVEMEKRLNAAIKSAVTDNQDDLKKVYQLKQYYAIIQKCVPFRYLLGMANCLFAKLKTWLMKWLLGFKSQNDTAAKNFSIQVEHSALSKTYFMLRTILDRMSLAIEGGFEQIWTMCDSYGNVTPTGDALVDQILADASMKFDQPTIDKPSTDGQYWHDIGEPVYPFSRKVGVVPNDVCDTLYENNEWPVPSYASMPEYNIDTATEASSKGTQARNDITSLFKTDIVPEETIKVDEHTIRARDCRDTTFISSVFNELRSYHDAIKSTK